MADHEGDGKDGIDRASPELRKSALAISGLLLTADRQLAQYRERRADSPAATVERLRRARDLLDLVGQALAAKDEQPWLRLEDAWRALERAEPLPAAPGASSSERAAAPEPSAGPAASSDEGTASAAASAPLGPPALGAQADDVAPLGPGKQGSSPWMPSRSVGPSPPLGATPPRPVQPVAAPKPPDRSRSPRRVPPPAVPAAAAPSGSIAPHPVGERRDDESGPASEPTEHTRRLRAAAAAGPALPFVDGVFAPAPAPTAPKSKDPLNQTVTALFDDLGATLPFQRTLAEVIGAGSVAEAAGAAAPDRATDSHEGEPAPAPRAAPSADAMPASPPSKPVAPEDDVTVPIALTLEQHATLCAECAVYPEHVEAIQARYGIAGQHARALVEADWHKRIAADAALAERWRSCFTQVQQWLIRQRGG